MKKRKKVDRVILVDINKLIRFSVLLLMCALALFSAFQLIKRFLTVEDFEIVGISQYDSEDLINASGVKRGYLLYSLDEEEIEKRILEECPYLESVTVKAKFPNKLRIEAEGKSAQWYLEISGTKYALDGNLIVIAETAKTERMTKLVLPNLKKVIYGEVPEFGESETEIKKTLEVISAIRQTTFKTRLTEVNLESRWDIHVTVDETYLITMGDLSDFDAKLRAVEAILASETLKNCVGGEMDVSIPANPSFRPIYASDTT